MLTKEAMSSCSIAPFINMGQTGPNGSAATPTPNSLRGFNMDSYVGEGGHWNIWICKKPSKQLPATPTPKSVWHLFMSRQDHFSMFSSHSARDITTSASDDIYDHHFIVSFACVETDNWNGHHNPTRLKEEWCIGGGAWVKNREGRQRLVEASEESEPTISSLLHPISDNPTVLHYESQTSSAPIQTTFYFTIS